MKKIIAISAGQDDWKKDFGKFRQHVHYLNYGLLGLVSIINKYGDYDIQMFQAEGDVEDLIFDIESAGVDLKTDCEYVLLSIPSFYSVSWAATLCSYLKKYSDIRIVVGGRWVVDNHVDWVKEKLGDVFLVMEGFGEEGMSNLFNLSIPEEKKHGERCCFEELNYKLLYNFRKYSPSIEVSRGCGSGCHFCLDAHNKRVQNKSIENIMKELDGLDEVFGDSYNVYFEAPHFIFEKQWIKEFSLAMKKRKRIVPWRCTTRVETIPLDLLKDLAGSGLKILDIGLESASKQQLLKMGKTNNPDAYLEKAENILKVCNECGIWVKFNILLYAGENEETIGETANWLKKNMEYIKDISVSNLIFFYGMDNLDELQRLGASIPEGENVLNKGYGLKAELCLSLSADTAITHI